MRARRWTGDGDDSDDGARYGRDEQHRHRRGGATVRGCPGQGPRPSRALVVTSVRVPGHYNWATVTVNVCVAVPTEFLAVIVSV